MIYECERCRIPKSCYDLKHEPSLGNPDFTMPNCCQYGHFWITKVTEIIEVLPAIPLPEYQK